MTSAKLLENPWNMLVVNSKNKTVLFHFEPSLLLEKFEL